jgi:hypothetical protein
MVRKFQKRIEKKTEKKTEKRKKRERKGKEKGKKRERKKGIGYFFPKKLPVPFFVPKNHANMLISSILGKCIGGFYK